MAKVVVAFPKLSPGDFDFIQSIRKESDELYFNVVDPHFTIIFPVFTEIDETTLINHVVEKSKRFSAFDFVLNKAILNDDAFSNYWHVFLVPDQGNEEIVKLHDEIYTGILEPELRKDIPFVPHIGIANSLNKSGMQKLADKINQDGIKISGKIDSLDICGYIDDTITSIRRISLK